VTEGGLVQGNALAREKRKRKGEEKFSLGEGPCYNESDSKESGGEKKREKGTK